VYALRHDVRGPSHTLRISRRVLENFPAFAVLYHLDQIKVAQAMRARPKSRLVVMQKGSTVVLDEESRKAGATRREWPKGTPRNHT
jgi:hypothetical protein